MLDVKIITVTENLGHGVLSTAFNGKESDALHFFIKREASAARKVDVLHIEIQPARGYTDYE